MGEKGCVFFELNCVFFLIELNCFVELCGNEKREFKREFKRELERMFYLLRFRYFSLIPRHILQIPLVLSN